MAALKEGSIKPGTKELDQMFNNLVGQCNKKSLLDRMNEKRAAFRNINTPIETQTAFLVGTDACPGLVIPAGTSFADTGTTIGATNTVTSVQAGCSNYTTHAGPDVIYRFNLPDVGQRVPTCTIVVTPTAGSGYDPAIFNLSSNAPGCPAGPAAAATNCVNGADVGLANAAETITDAEMDAMPAGTYYLFIDSFYSTPSGTGASRHQGPYSLAFNCTTVAPTAAGLTVSGRVLTGEDGRGLIEATVTMTDAQGNVRTAISGKRGFYMFEDVEAGQTYVFRIESKRFSYSPRVIEVLDNVADLDFTPDQ